MTTQRLDTELVARGLVASRSQAESYIKLGQVIVDGRVATKPAKQVTRESKIVLTTKEQYVSRAGFKLSSVALVLRLDFRDKVVLDVGSSTGGFTDYALRHGARKVIAVDVGTNQLHASLRFDSRVELHEQTDIRAVTKLSEPADIVVIDVSFISLRDILPSIAKLVGAETEIVAMVKPQFETAQSGLKHKGVIKNDKMRRDTLKAFENWVQKLFVIKNKADSEVAGAKGNLERFYVLQKVI